MKQYFKKFFSDQTRIDYWEHIYDQENSTGVRARMSQALLWIEELALLQNSTILDAGCGAGIITAELAKRDHILFGMDYSYGMIQKTNLICDIENNLNANLLQGDVETLPFKDSSLDAILCLGVITYLNYEKKAFSEFSRVLKPGGTLIFSIINRARLAKNLDLPLFFKSILSKVLDTKIAFCRKKTPTYRTSNLKTYFIPKVMNSLQIHGLQTLEYTTVPLELITFLGREIPPRRINIKITMLLEKFSNIPLIGSFGGMCIFNAQKVSHIISKKSSLPT